jgi:hypothetical protein
MDFDILDRSRFSFPDQRNALGPRHQSVKGTTRQRRSLQSRPQAETPSKVVDRVPDRRESFTPLVEEDRLYLFHPLPERRQDTSSHRG